ncbi:hypothetical protein POL68_39295 [Stigmatella sp. ncwal1]|uniref:Lipase modulator n=1 Tax=Stigmatella ashevillensis TaxID=2995309 RepID=A0ABT5DN37_9BACT|nr:hypothetical protein [Stigmatella ashevillena]MDC0714560.1 hypothetical protein [Stigmatella ashevillena]
MGMNVFGKALPRRVVGGAAVLVLGVSLWLWLTAPQEPRAPGESAPASPGTALAPPSPDASALPGTVPAREPDVLTQSVQVPPGAEALSPAGYPVNLEQLKARLPGNLYWKTAAPTKDPQLLQERAEQERSQNVLFGKIQAGDASEEEIQQYYDYRRQLSEDYLSFAAVLLSDQGAQLPERDRGVLELSVQMHRDRLKALPRQREEALERKQLQDRRREEWRRSRGGNTVPP